MTCTTTRAWRVLALAGVATLAMAGPGLAGGTLPMDGTWQSAAAIGGAAGQCVTVYTDDGSGSTQAVTGSSPPASTARGRALGYYSPFSVNLSASLYVKGPAGTNVSVDSGACGAGGGGTSGNSGPATVANGADVSEGSTTDQPAASPTTTATIQSVLRGIWTRLNGTLSVTGPSTVADGANVTQGTTTDQPAVSPTAAGTLESVLRGIWAKLNGTLAVTGTFFQAIQPVSGTVYLGSTGGSLNAAGGVSSFGRVVSPAATTNALVFRTVAARLYTAFGCNLSTSDLTFHFTDSATAPTPGSTAVRVSLTAPASATAGKCAPFSMPVPADIGYSFSAGIGYWASTGVADTDTTAPAAANAFTLTVGFQ